MKLKTTCALSAVACFMLPACSNMSESLGNLGGLFSQDIPTECWASVDNKTRSRAEVEECISHFCWESVKKSDKDKKLSREERRNQANTCIEVGKAAYDRSKK